MFIMYMYILFFFLYISGSSYHQVWRGWWRRWVGAERPFRGLVHCETLGWLFKENPEWFMVITITKSWSHSCWKMLFHVFFFLLKQYHRNIDKNTIALSCSRNEWLDPDMSGGGLALFCVGSRGGRLVGCCVCLSEFLLMFVLNAVPPWIPASYGALPYFQIHLCGLVFSRTQLQMSGPKIEEPGRFHKWLKKT